MDQDLDPRDLTKLTPGTPEYRSLAERLVAAELICPGFECDGCYHCSDEANRRGIGPVGPIGEKSRAGGVTSNQYGTFQNHDASPAQLSFIVRLRAERGLIAPDGERLTKKAATRLIDELLETPKAATAPKVDPNRRANRFPGSCVDCGARVPEGEGWIEKVDGKWVTHHEGDCPARPAPEAKPAEVTEDGMYQDPTTGDVFKVQIAHHGSGNLYAKKLVVGESGKGRFDYDPGRIRHIRPEWKMGLDQAVAFGKLYGICCQCAAVLTDERSIAAGIGPVCATKF